MLMKFGYIKNKLSGNLLTVTYLRSCSPQFFLFELTGNSIPPLLLDFYDLNAKF